MNEGIKKNVLTMLNKDIHIMAKYRPNVAIILHNSKFEVFLGERLDMAGKWQFPQGGIEEDLSEEKSALRELEEELGADPNLFRLIMRCHSTHRYLFPQIPPGAKGMWDGQFQTFWIASFLGKDNDINLQKHTPEFRSWKWVQAEEVLNTVDEFRKEGYRSPVNEFLSYRDKNYHL